MTKRQSIKKYDIELCRIVYQDRKLGISYYPEILLKIQKYDPSIQLDDLIPMRDRWANRLIIEKNHEKRKVLQEENPINEIGPHQVKHLIRNSALKHHFDKSEQKIFENPLSGDPSWREQYALLKYLKGNPKRVDYSQIKLIGED
jgi:hypothetical protein